MQTDATDNEVLIESLAPSAAMLPLLGALSEALELPESFTWADVEKASEGRVLATAEIVGRYTLNPRL